jgi:hypothetical protein
MMNDNPHKIAIQYVDKATQYSSGYEKDVHQALWELCDIMEPDRNLKPTARNDENIDGTPIDSRNLIVLPSPFPSPILNLPSFLFRTDLQN